MTMKLSFLARQELLDDDFVAGGAELSREHGLRRLDRLLRAIPR